MPWVIRADGRMHWRYERTPEPTDIGWWNIGVTNTTLGTGQWTMGQNYDPPPTPRVLYHVAETMLVAYLWDQLTLELPCRWCGKLGERVFTDTSDAYGPACGNCAAMIVCKKKGNEHEKCGRHKDGIPRCATPEKIEEEEKRRERIADKAGGVGGVP